MRARVLYISYDGLLEPLGQSQVLQYLRGLAQRHDVTLLTFEKPHDWARLEERTRVQRDVAEAGIRWTALRYHKRPSAVATAYDVVAGVVVGLSLAIRRRARIVHARSYVASVMALAIRRLTGARFIFDMRGFWADERVDGGIWPAGSRLYRAAKWFERRFFTQADAVVSLTHAGARAIRSLPYLADGAPPLRVVPTCTNLALFRPLPRPPGRGAPFTLGYVGSAGTWYLFDEVLQAFAALQELRPGACFLVLNRGDHAYISERLSAAGVREERVELKAVDFGRVAEEMARMDAGIFYYKPAFSRLGTAPTRLGEFLGCGIPCISNVGVGDVREVLENERVGVAVEDLSPPGQRDAVDRLLRLAAEPGVRDRCVEVARRLFSLERGVAAYDDLYRALAADAR